MLRNCSYSDSNLDRNLQLRTEDVRFSPSGRMLALASSTSISLLEIDVNHVPIRIGARTEMRSKSIEFPHGVDFLSEGVIVVANRDAWVTFYRIPEPDNWAARMDIEAIHEFASPWFGSKQATRIIDTGRTVRCGPGSVRVHGSQLYICANHTNTVSKHPFTMHNGEICVGEGALVAQAGLNILDGIAITRDGQWIALADAGNHRVVLCRGDGSAGTSVLRDPRLGTPHGLCFDPSGKLLYVSDAGGQLLHVFESQGGHWGMSMERSSSSVMGIGEEAFHKTKLSVREEYRPLVGGLKGLDIDPSGRFVVGTCLNQFLVFFDTSANVVESGLVSHRP